MTREGEATALAAACLLPSLLALWLIPDAQARDSILVSLAISFVGYLATKALIPTLKRFTLRAGLGGLDINKRGTEAGEKRVPESLGLAPGVVFLVIVVLFQQLHYHDLPRTVGSLLRGDPPLQAWRDGGRRPSAAPGASEAWLVDYNAALASICFMLFLGFADDVLDVPWRVKLALPTVAALPLLIAYSGGTSVLVPLPLRRLGGWALGGSFPSLTYPEGAVAGLPDLLAGAWGARAAGGGAGGASPALDDGSGILEAGSASVPGGAPGAAPLLLPRLLDVGPLYHLYLLALVIFSTNSINILAGVNGLEVGQTMVVAGAILLHNTLQVASARGRADPAFRDGHLFSAYLVAPLLLTSAALLRFNWFPSAVFVGDTFTYFAGMTIAVAGILGHFSETLLLFLLPQIINFVYSIPQLFHFVHCPRHRLPTFDPKTGLLTATPNMNLVNAFLRLFGRTTERGLCIRLLLFQALCCAGAFALRGGLEGVYKP